MQRKKKRHKRQHDTDRHAWFDVQPFDDERLDAALVEDDELADDEFADESYDDDDELDDEEDRIWRGYDRERGRGDDDLDDE